MTLLQGYVISQQKGVRQSDPRQHRGERVGRIPLSTSTMASIIQNFQFGSSPNSKVPVKIRWKALIFFAEPFPKIGVLNTCTFVKGEIPETVGIQQNTIEINFKKCKKKHHSRSNIFYNTFVIIILFPNISRQKWKKNKAN